MTAKCLRNRLLLPLALLAAAAPAAATGLLEERREQCAQCHGESGVSETPETPSLGGQPELFILYQLVAFRDGQRDVPIMNEIMKGMTDDDLRAAAAWIATLAPPPPPHEQGDPARMARGRALAEKHRCNVCHTADYSGQEQVPRIRNQREDYLLKALTDYKTGKRFGGRAEMNDAVRPLNAEELAVLASFLAHVR